MEYRNLGKSGLKVSRLCLGCMSYGNPQKGHHPWVLSEEVGRPFIKKALESGINFFDTANMYGEGASEEVLGRAIREFTKREEVVIASKVYFPMRQDPNGKGLSRKAILTEVDHSLKRLDTDYIDLYQIHRWDYETPIEETLEALHDVVKSGKVRYIGASSMYAYQFCQALYRADLKGFTRFISMQNHYNLLNREEEREMFKLCKEEGIGVIPWSPLARGRLTRPWGSEGTTPRHEQDKYGKSLYAATEEADRQIVGRVIHLANQKQVPPAQIALAWILQNPIVTAPIIGATRLSHLEDALASLSIKLTESEVLFLEELYLPHPTAGYV